MPSPIAGDAAAPMSAAQGGTLFKLFEAAFQLKFELGHELVHVSFPLHATLF